MKNGASVSLTLLVALGHVLFIAVVVCRISAKEHYTSIYFIYLLFNFILFFVAFVILSIFALSTVLTALPYSTFCIVVL